MTKTLTKWHQREEQACRDWNRSEYRTAAERRDAAVKRREALWGALFWVVLAAGVVGWPWA